MDEDRICLSVNHPDKGWTQFEPWLREFTEWDVSNRTKRVDWTAAPHIEFDGNAEIFRWWGITDFCAIRMQPTSGGTFELMLSVPTDKADQGHMKRLEKALRRDWYVKTISCPE